MSETYRANYRFVVKESADGTPWITLEPLSGTIAPLKDAIIGFDLPKGTDLGQANVIADYLDSKIESVSYTELK